MTDQQVASLKTALQRNGHPNPAALIRIVGRLFAAYEGHQGTSPQRYAVYIEDLADLPLELVERACIEVRRESKFLPTIAELRARVAQWQLDAAGVSTSPESAWAEVLRKVQAEGTLRIPGKETSHGPPIVFDDPVTGAVMTATWWRQLGQTPTAMIGHERRAFVEAYSAHLARVASAAKCGRTLPASAPRRELMAGKR
jgi:hypothetical protein